MVINIQNKYGHPLLNFQKINFFVFLVRYLTLQIRWIVPLDVNSKGTFL